jgi:hypothetical protein
MFLERYRCRIVALTNTQLARSEPIMCQEVTAEPNPQIVQGDYPDYPSFLAAKYPVPALTPIVGFRVTINFLDSHITGWKDDQKARVLQAAQLFQMVWSSQEFKDKVSAIPSLLWHEGTEDEQTYPSTISGADLYPKLISKLDVTMPLKLIWDFRDQTAATSNDFTNFEKGWASSADVYDVCNTLSHEYTHYIEPGWSWDGNHSSVLRNYVSYGIGGLTENLAAQVVRCCDDPTQ